MKKYLYLVFIVMSSLAVQAQKKDTKANKQKETVLEEIQVVEEETIEVEEVEETVIGSSSRNSGVIYVNKKRYKTRKINNNCVIYYKESDNNFGIIKNGKRLFPNIFYGRYFNNHGSNIIILTINDKSSYTKIYGVFDLLNEKWILPLEYKGIKKLTANYYAVKKDEYYAIYDLENKEIIANEKWKYISEFDGIGSGYYSVKNDDNSSGVYNIISKKTIIPCAYESLSYDSNLNYFMAKKDNKYNYLSVKNQFLFKNWYDRMTYKDGFFIVKKDGKMGVIDRSENEIVPIKYLMILGYKWGNTNSHLAQNEEKKFGFITIDGTVTLPFIYDDINIENTTFVKLKTADDKCGILVKEDNKIKIIASCKYDDINRKSGYFVVVKNGKYGLLDAKGKKVLDEKYDDISKLALYRNELVLKKGTNYFLFSNGLVSKEKHKDIKSLKIENGYSPEKYLVVKSNANKYGLMDYFEVMVTPFMFDDIISQYNDNYLLVKMGKKLGVYDVLNQKMIVAAEYESIINNGSFFYGIKGTIIDKIKITPKVTITRL